MPERSTFSSRTGVLNSGGGLAPAAPTMTPRYSSSCSEREKGYVRGRSEQKEENTRQEDGTVLLFITCPHQTTRRSGTRPLLGYGDPVLDRIELGLRQHVLYNDLLLDLIGPARHHLVGVILGDP